MHGNNNNMQSLITPTGELIAADPATLRCRTGAIVADDGLAGFLIRNMGYASIGRNGDTIAVRLAPARLTLAAYTRLAELLEESQSRRVSISSYNGEWQYEILPGVHQALERLARLLMTARGDVGPRFYIAEPRAVSNLPPDHPFTKLIARWRVGGGRLKVSDEREVLDGAIGGRYSIIAVDRQTGQAVFKALGPGYELYDQGWTERFVGQRVDDQPDIAYGRSVANCYRAAIAGNKPQLTDVDAIIRNPKLRCSLHGRYKRLALPLATYDDEALLLSTTLLDHSVDFRSQIQQ
ncbi:MAG: hypothetical protein ACR2OV_11635 [Hyphomicrobiaceae bacterium]